MSNLQEGAAPKENRCRECNTELTIGENWRPLHAKRHIQLCTDCHNKTKQKERYQKRVAKTPEEKKLQKIKAMIDEPRIDRMVEWIKEYNLDYYVGGILDRARAKNPANPDEAERKAYDEIKHLKYEDIPEENRRSDIEIMDEILIRHAITEPSEGDTGATWWIAFHHCGYTAYELDDDGLPLARPGILRMSMIARMRKMSDKKFAGRTGRVGIVSIPFREIPRRPKTEHRIIICKREEDFHLLDERRRLRHGRENDLFAKLRLSMGESLDEKQSIIDQLVGIYNRI